MSLRDFFRRKKEPKGIEVAKETKATKEAKGAKETKATKGAEVAKETKATKATKEAKVTKVTKGAKVSKRKKVKRSIKSFLLDSPHITEKATDLQTKDQYTFRVPLRANKTEIRNTVERLYDVDVISVKIIKVPKKKRIVKQITGWRKGYKKAVVKVAKGQKIVELTV